MEPAAKADTSITMTGLNPRLRSVGSPPMRLLRGLAGRVLPCGCLVGVYETYRGGVVATVDARGPSCDDSKHRLHDIVELNPPPAKSAAERHTAAERV